MRLHQELSEDDFDRRVEFGKVTMGRIDDNPEFLWNNVFLDGATWNVELVK